MRKASWALTDGSGSVLAIGLIAAVLSLSAVIGVALDERVRQARLNALAENAAIAGADALRGLAAGYPCDVVREFTAQVETCEVIGTDVRVILRDGSLSARARAGEP